LTEPPEINSEQWRVDHPWEDALVPVRPDPLGGIMPADHPLGAGGSPDGGDLQGISSGWRLALREFMSNRLAVLGLAVLVFFLLFSFLGPHIYHGNTTISNPLDANLAPGGGHPIGTDENGFDELARMMQGGQAAFEVGVFAAVIAIVIGTLYGAIAGLVGGFLDGVMMRLVDVLLSIPFLFIVLVVSTKYSGSVIEISLVLGVFSWLIPARLVRGEVLTLRERDFVSAARVMGGSRTRIVMRHLIPNAMSVTIVNVTFLIADSMLALAYLGALGLGLSYPHTSWGDMLGQASTYVQNGQWWLVYPVGACLVLVVLACNLVGDALRDAIDVRLRRR
jgi:ABC-type dipeptide/oligopeptide/nickel transport system permease subunit